MRLIFWKKKPTPAPEPPKPEPRVLVISGPDALEVARLADNFNRLPKGEDNEARILFWGKVATVCPETVEGNWEADMRRLTIAVTEKLPK